MDYALELGTPVRHVATELERADHALSISELAATYTHPNHSDLVRVKKHEGATTDEEAVVFLIELALKKLARYISNGNGRYTLVVPFDSIRLNRHKIERLQPKGRFEDSFDPLSDGRFADNIRNPNTAREKNIAEELRESMRAFGWVPELPAIRDERGVVLVGHRRLKIAEELGIEPVYMNIRVGRGDAADARRFAIAIASNLGGKLLSPSDRKDLAEYLYGEQEWTMARVAEALNVSQQTISNDLRDLPTTGKSKPGRGRPRKLTDEQIAEVIEKRFEQGKTRVQIAEEMGVTEAPVRMAIQQEEGARRAREELATAVSVQNDQVSHDCICPVCGRRDTHE